MWRLSAFADEISPDFGEQCSLLRELGVRHLDLRSAWDTNVLDLDEGQLARVIQTLKRSAITVSAVGSPIGKIYLDDDFDDHMARMRQAVKVAHLVSAPYIRVFSFFVRPGTDPDSGRDEVLRRLAKLTRIAEEENIVLLHENEKDIYGDTPSRCLDIIESINSEHLRATWDPANFVQVGNSPFSDGYAMLRPYLVHMQVKDAISATGQVVPAGRGDAQIVETVRALQADGFQGYFSLEPHLGIGHSMGGFSGPDLFTEAWRAFTAILAEEDIGYN